MKVKKFLSCVVAALLAAPAFAQDYTSEQMNAMANRYFESPPTGKSALSSKIKLDTLYLNGAPKMILYQDGHNWVVFANEQTVEPIVCLGEGRLDLDNLWESPLGFLLTESMIGLDSLRIMNKERGVTPPIYQAKTNISKSTTRPTPLLDLREENRWGQSHNNSGSIADVTKIYNKFCPTFFDKAHGRTLVGCTAVAMAQVMWYHQFPASAKIPKRINKAGVTSSEKVTRHYNWNLMPGRIYNSSNVSQADAVASLLRDCGYAGNMIYAKIGSGMTLTNAIAALRNDFNYTAHMKQYSSGATKFTYIIKKEIASKRPVIIQATHKSKGGTHSFVIDGYDSASEMFHLNMGWWDRPETTWYSVSGANCYGGYTIARRMLYQIMPNRASQSTKQLDTEEFVEEEEITKDLFSFDYASHTISIKADGQDANWMICDVYGNVVLRDKSNLINYSTLRNGTYVFVLDVGGETQQMKFIKK